MKLKILIIIIGICILMLTFNAIAKYPTYFPPATDWHQGYWDATAGSSANKTDAYMYFDIEGGNGDGDQILYESVDRYLFKDVTHIRIDWKADFGAVAGAVLLGFSNGPGTHFCQFNITRAVTFGRTNDTLYVAGVTSNQYIKVGGYTSSVGLSDDINLWVYEIVAYNENLSCFPLNATLVEETDAILNGYLDNGTGMYTCGFWLGNETTSQALVDAGIVTNITAVGTYGPPTPFSHFVDSLTPAEYYYVRTWCKDDIYMNISANETYFITKPNAITSFRTLATGPSNITLAWTNSSFPAGTNHSIYIRYSSTGYPATITQGNFGANESALNQTDVTGLFPDTTYYFSAWTYANNSGSPSMGRFSDGFGTSSGETEGGTYNITVRYENESIAGNLPVNLSRWGIHKFTIHYAYKTDYITFNNGIHSSTVFGIFSNNASGNFTLVTNETILYIEFHWNGSLGYIVNCYRIQIVDSGQRSITFYIRTNLPVYGEGTTKTFHTDSATITDPTSDLVFSTTYALDEIYGVYIYNISIYPMWETVSNDNYTISGNQITIDSGILNVNTTMAKIEYYTYETVSGVTGPLDNTLVRYTYYFKDETSIGYFEGAPALDAWAEIYCYNSTGTKLSIHKEYWAGDQKVYPWLIYNKKYYIGVGCTRLTISRIGIAPTGSDTEPDPINIPDPGNLTYAFFDVIDIDMGWNGAGNGFWVYYQDSLYDTFSVTFRVWDRNGTMVYNETSSLDFKNFTYSGAHNLYKYNWTITTSHSAWSTNQTIQAPIYPGMTPISDVTSLNNLIDLILGNTPLVNQVTGQEVPWAYVLVGIIAFILGGSFGAYNAYVGTLAVGAWFAFAGGAIEDIPVGFILVGVFLMSMAIVFALGGKFR